MWEEEEEEEEEEKGLSILQRVGIVGDGAVELGIWCDWMVVGQCLGLTVRWIRGENIVR